MFNMAIWRRTDTPIIEVLHPTNEYECLASYNSNMMSLWLDGDRMAKVLIDNDDLYDWSFNDYEDEFVVNAKQ